MFRKHSTPHSWLLHTRISGLKCSVPFKHIFLFNFHSGIFEHTSIFHQEIKVRKLMHTVTIMVGFLLLSTATQAYPFLNYINYDLWAKEHGHKMFHFSLQILFQERFMFQQMFRELCAQDVQQHMSFLISSTCYCHQTLTEPKIIFHKNSQQFLSCYMQTDVRKLVSCIFAILLPILQNNMVD
jgi:hypothetical protein